MGDVFSKKRKKKKEKTKTKKEKMGWIMVSWMIWLKAPDSSTRSVGNKQMSKNITILVNKMNVPKRESSRAQTLFVSW